MKNQEELKRVIREVKKDLAVAIYYKDIKKIDARNQELNLLLSELQNKVRVIQE